MPKPLCDIRHGSYLCWRLAGHGGRHQSWYRTSQGVASYEWEGPYSDGKVYRKLIP